MLFVQLILIMLNILKILALALGACSQLDTLQKLTKEYILHKIPPPPTHTVTTTNMDKQMEENIRKECYFCFVSRLLAFLKTKALERLGVDKITYMQLADCLQISQHRNITTPTLVAKS